MSEFSRYRGYRDLGKFLPKKYSIQREERQLAEEEERQAVRRAAMLQATLTKYREPLARKLYQGQAITFDDFPALEALTPKERTKILADLHELFGIPERKRS
jgi:hypothetical protein